MARIPEDYSRGPRKVNPRNIVASIWAVWSIYMVVQAVRSKDERLGNAINAIFTATTSYMVAT